MKIDEEGNELIQKLVDENKSEDNINKKIDKKNTKFFIILKEVLKIGKYGLVGYDDDKLIIKSDKGEFVTLEKHDSVLLDLGLSKEHIHLSNDGSYYDVKLSKKGCNIYYSTKSDDLDILLHIKQFGYLYASTENKSEVGLSFDELPIRKVTYVKGLENDIERVDVVYTEYGSERKKIMIRKIENDKFSENMISVSLDTEGKFEINENGTIISEVDILPNNVDRYFKGLLFYVENIIEESRANINKLNDNLLSAAQEIHPVNSRFNEFYDNREKDETINAILNKFLITNSNKNQKGKILCTTKKM